ncbi:hypothetical protein [Methylocystis bryophila]|uniref:Uncharacterized protein n=1 Tax=Methylocystis bryophila TaxID=655015 RepID=A0A1W6MX36_9HYPH|nr:hypothetical protein [Methylocystis bryophila]ARN82147.1 hypothetical protein B1812_14850 [Methylocystis bryophila]BDV38278.1 hypothetical protein DSM21852_15310 [Methylocystis bryophila]
MNESAGVFFSPLMLILGGGLFTLGLLSVFGLNFFKSTFQAGVALAMGLAFLVVTEAMFLTGNSGRYFLAQGTDVTDCEYKAEQNNPLERGKRSSVIPDEIRACMDRLGYDWITEHPHCEEAKLATNSFCYLPKARFSRAIVAWQMKFE